MFLVTSIGSRRGIEGVDVDWVADGPVGPHGAPHGQELEAGEAALAGEDQVAGVETAEALGSQPSLPVMVEAALTKWRVGH